MRAKRWSWAFLLSLSAWGATENATLRVKVLDIHPLVGTFRIWLCNNEDCYKTRGDAVHPYYNVVRKDLPQGEPVTRKETSFEFTNLPEGEYSVFLHHDKDNDGLVDSKTCGWFGKPVDGLAYSNGVDPRSLWREPRWNEVKVSVAEAQTLELKIKMIYMCD